MTTLNRAHSLTVPHFQILHFQCPRPSQKILDSPLVIAATAATAAAAAALINSRDDVLADGNRAWIIDERE